MNKTQIDRFFKTLDRELGRSARVILTGAAAGTLMGNTRQSIDIDFAINLIRKNKLLWDQVGNAVERTKKLTAIEANYAEDIDAWGLITLLDYKRHIRPYKRFGRLSVGVMDPVYWSIGKITRYFGSDESDLARVFKRQKVRPEDLIRIWAKALRRSPRTASLFLFRKQAEYFLRAKGRAVWGKKFDPEKTIKAFNDAL